MSERLLPNSGTVTDGQSAVSPSGTRCSTSIAVEGWGCTSAWSPLWIKKMFDEEPQKAAALAEELIKNTYRTLMTRSMKGCYLHCCDDQPQAYLRTRIENMQIGGA